MGERTNIWMVTVGHVRVKGTDYQACALGYGPYFTEKEKDRQVEALEAGVGMCHPGCMVEDEAVDLTITEHALEPEVWRLMKQAIPPHPPWPGFTKEVFRQEDEE